MMTETLHKHHIVPRHMGGMDEPWNIMELSREDHAWAHLILYKLYGKEEDLWAAQFICGDRVKIDISGDKNPMANPDIRKKHDEAMRNRDQSGEKNPMWGKERPDNLWRGQDPDRIAKQTEYKTNWWNNKKQVELNEQRDNPLGRILSPQDNS